MGGLVDKVVQGLGDITGIRPAKKAAKAQEAAALKQSNLERLREARARSQQLRQAQVQRARALTAGAAQGALQSSSVQGGLASIDTQSAENFAFSQQVSRIQDDIGTLRSNAIRYQGRAGIAQDVIGLGATAYSMG